MFKTHEKVQEEKILSFLTVLYFQVLRQGVYHDLQVVKFHEKNLKKTI